ncbi:MAG: RNA polymerase-associated protein RapA [Candidatus Thiodiazotropha sp.]
MAGYQAGQRWISESESELGLGIVTGFAQRRVTIAFPAAGETRVYADRGAPLTRVSFAPGDRVESQEGWSMQVLETREEAGLLTYLGKREDGVQVSLAESRLSHLLRIDQPKQRLLSGQIDPPNWFSLRYHTLSKLGDCQQSPTLGLGGARIELIPHQLYIAHEVTRRPAPRVLLADEVGLGKTIEACLILHRQLLTGRASRVLILVPDPLVHQWLVELLRRFNLSFRIFDEAACQAIQDSGEAENPFHAEQRILCSLGLFQENPERLSQALEGEWDLLIVDEAHHLSWSEEDPSAEYLLVEALALKTPGILLLTATPEQLGLAGHFARLRLLDPDRYYDLRQFLEEERLYQPVAEAVEYLLRQQQLPESAAHSLLSRLDEEASLPLLQRLHDEQASEAERQSARESLIGMLLDRHGTGRVLFRNTRHRIQGFPERELQAVALPMPESYLECLNSRDGDIPPALLLTPEQLVSGHGSEDWWQQDPRVNWLIDTLKQNPQSKYLLICAHDDTAVILQEALRLRSGIAAGVFHKDMSIIERDRAAAWFADPEGARLLICSEIGSEGRNFQFAHHLILFDLPLDPDLLEQRIGRLDRIGQRQTIQIHVPYLEPGPQALMFHWYRDALEGFRQPVNGAQSIYESVSDALYQALSANAPEALDPLIRETRETRLAIQERLSQGRDHLLELGSCREPQASELVRQLRREDATTDLADYLQRLFDSYNIDTEPLGDAGLVLKPGEQVIAGTLPGLPEDGLTVTLDRKDALSHEERQFLTWEHPLVINAMDQILSQQTGNACAVIGRLAELGKGQLLLEALYVLECPAPRPLQVSRFLPPTLERVLLDSRARRWDSQIDCDSLDARIQGMEAMQLQAVLKHYRPMIEQLMEQAEELARGGVEKLTRQAVKRMTEHYTHEIQRLQALKKHNPSVRQEEIMMLQDQAVSLHQHLQASRLRLDALRLVVTV